MDSNRLNATVRWTVAGDGLTEPNNYLRKAQMQTSGARGAKHLALGWQIKRPERVAAVYIFKAAPTAAENIGHRNSKTDCLS